LDYFYRSACFIPCCVLVVYLLNEPLHDLTFVPCTFLCGGGAWSLDASGPSY